MRVRVSDCSSACSRAGSSIAACVFPFRTRHFNHQRQAFIDQRGQLRCRRCWLGPVVTLPLAELALVAPRRAQLLQCGIHVMHQRRAWRNQHRLAGRRPLLFHLHCAQACSGALLQPAFHCIGHHDIGATSADLIEHGAVVGMHRQRGCRKNARARSAHWCRRD